MIEEVRRRVCLGGRRNGEGKYQFAATMGLLLMFRRLDLGFWRTRGRDDLFFFFWRGRAIIELVWMEEEKGCRKWWW